MMSVQFVPCALKQADGKVVFILSTSLINHVFDVLSRHSLNSSKPRTSLQLLLLFPNVPYVLTIATLLVLYSLEVKTHKTQHRERSWRCSHWSNDTIFKNKKQKQCICWKHFSAKAGIPSIQCVNRAPGSKTSSGPKLLSYLLRKIKIIFHLVSIWCVLAKL